MDRRKFVIGIGGIAASAGAVLGSGAFSQVQADRTVNVVEADDAAAYLQLTPGSGSSTYFVDDSGNEIVLNFDNVDANLGDGVNGSAISSFDNLVKIQNEGSNDVTLSYSATDTNGTDVTGDLKVYTGTVTDGTDTELTSYTLTANTGGAGSSVEVGIQLNTNNLDPSTESPYTLTIEATA